jgi:preprotein translocase subunit SecE
MSSVDPSAGQMADKLKVAVAVLLVVAGLIGFYYLSGSPAVVRLASVLGGLAAGIAVGWFSVPGRRLFGFAQESVTEARKVVWPTRKESFQTAGAVFAFVVVMAAFLWVSDKSLEYLLYDLILGWKK